MWICSRLKEQCPEILPGSAVGFSSWVFHLYVTSVPYTVHHSEIPPKQGT